MSYGFLGESCGTEYRNFLVDLVQHLKYRELLEKRYSNLKWFVKFLPWRGVLPQTQKSTNDL